MDPGVTRLVGVDLSLTSTGIARVYLDSDGTVVGTHTEVTGQTLPERAPLDEQIDRVDRVARDVVSLVGAPDLLVVEGPLPGGRAAGGTSEEERAWLRGLVYRRIHRAGIPLVEVAPSTLKLYATGNGRAGKPLVVQAIRRHYGDRFDIPLRKSDGQQDVADAIALVAMAARSVGHPIDLDHPTRERAMRAPRWATREDER